MIRIGILYGGKSAEHEVSLRSAATIIAALDPKKYEPVLIAIDKTGRWHLGSNAVRAGSLQLSNLHAQVGFLAGQPTNTLMNVSTNLPVGSLDVIFPVLHGPFGEDGAIQGLLKMADIPYVGPGILGSAVGMDKDVMKRLLRDGGIKTARYNAFHDFEKSRIHFEELTKELGSPLFVKPANMGSSVGVHRVTSPEELQGAIEDAFQFDRKLIIEECIVGREIECAVMGNEQLTASLPGEIITKDDFYSYNEKYSSESVTEQGIPADLSKEEILEIQDVAMRTFRILGCEGMGRVDCFLRGEEIFVNEINTIPGFTSISMYPKLWEVSGIPLPELLDRLILLAIDRHKKESQLKTSV